ncbi:hypothetical protein AVEN_214373-1 [Araneus ventricosus]|uniref:Uncharacterized protein n=1 Tax=Araneus ventricosus TaxID=182803 RepID=A0A4Y2HP44_ARAVE|nr:hypothetical protein AVEN_214373-1 [Araneus ventricosus]
MGPVAFVTQTVVTRLEFGDGAGARSSLSEDGVGLEGWQSRCSCACASVWVVTVVTIGGHRLVIDWVGLFVRLPNPSAYGPNVNPSIFFK